ncbi:sugar phosphate isomerase/epimerase family protein [Parapedobacter pyrenivorans]|nr:sugar phosphate isomerase/epimerase [Parapedobacter pyrenivorans]
MMKIKIVMMLAVAAWCAGCTPGEQNEGSKVGVALYSFNRFSLEEGLQKAKQSGVDYVEGFSFQQLGGKFGERPLSALSESELADVRSLVQENGLRMVSMYADGKTSAEWQVLFEKGKQLGLKFLVGEPEPHLWDELDRLAGDYGLKLAIHQHAKEQSRFWHPDSVLAALEGHPNFAVCGDLGHWVRSGLDPVACLKQLEGRLASIHAKDLDAFGNPDAADVKVGSGIIDYKAVFAELRRQGFEGFIFVECEHDWDNNLDDVKAAVDLLTDWDRRNDV